MDLSSYISDLLFRYDCVIVPGLGGFVTNYQPASIQANNTFLPPSKGISFNKHLKNNDGLLVNAVATGEDVTYDEASTMVDIAVASIVAALNGASKVELNNIGVLHFDQEKRIQFMPSSTVNYLLDAYGLTSFQQFPVERKSIEEKVFEKVKETPVIPIAGRKKSRRWAVAAAITIPLAFFAIWLPTKYDLSSEINYATLNPFADIVQTYNPPVEGENLFVKVDKVDVKSSLSSIQNKNASVEIQFLKGEAPIVVKNNISIAEPISTKVVNKGVKLRYHIVAGCFSSKRNAKKLVKKLNNAGFEAWIVGKRKGLFTVSYSSFATRKEAVSALSAAQSHNSKAWILEY